MVIMWYVWMDVVGIYVAFFFHGFFLSRGRLVLFQLFGPIARRRVVLSL